MPPPPGEAKVMPPPGEARVMPPPGDARVIPPPPGSILRVGMAGMGDMADSCSTSLILGPLKYSKFVNSELILLGVNIGTYLAGPSFCFRLGRYFFSLTEQFSSFPI